VSEARVVAWIALLALRVLVPGGVLVPGDECWNPVLVGYRDVVDGLDAVRRALEPQFAVPVVVRNPDAGPGTQVAVPRVDAGVDDSDSSVGAAAVASLPGVGRVS
jgi:hypothetical protein